MKWLLCLFLLININCILAQQIVDTTNFPFLLNLKRSTTFSKALNNLNEIREGRSKKSFTVLHFGDSHIQGDFFSGEIRSLMQAEFGFSGQGILFPYSLCKSYGPKGVKVSFKGTWVGTNILKNTEKKNIGAAGYTLGTSNANAELTFDITDKFTGKTSNRISIWTSADSSFSDYRIAGLKLIHESSITPDLKVRTYESDSLITSFNLSFLNTEKSQGKFYFHGFEFVFENSSGINYHHLGVVGAQFTHLIYNAELVKKQIQQLNPDLIIFSFGTNEAYDAKVDTSFYYKSIATFINDIRLLVPSVEILLTTAPDTRSQGRTPPNQQTVNRQLLRLAENLDFSLYDLNEAMGGWGSLKNWFDNKLTLADKLHFNVQGYKLQGKMLAHAIFTEFNQSINSNQIDLMKLEDDLIVSLKPVIKKETQVQQDTFLTNESPILKQEKIIKPKPKSVTYTVKTGDTISEIARKHKTSIQKILVANRLKETSVIRPGQKLVIPRS